MEPGVRGNGGAVGSGYSVRIYTNAALTVLAAAGTANANGAFTIDVGNNTSAQFWVTAIDTPHGESLPVWVANDIACAAPNAALIPKEDQYIVYKVNSKKVAKITIDVGMIGDDVFEIKGGVAKGDNLVVRGMTGLRDGMRVNVVSP